MLINLCYTLYYCLLKKWHIIFIIRMSQSQIPGKPVEPEFWQGKVGRSRTIYLQHLKLHHCSYIALLRYDITDRPEFQVTFIVYMI